MCPAASNEEESVRRCRSSRFIMSSDLHLCVARNPVTLYNQLTAASAPARPPLRYLILTGGTPRVARGCCMCTCLEAVLLA